MDRESHPCPTCHKSFFRLKHLKRHQLSHESERPYRCELCAKSFTRKDGLQRHEVTHNTSSTSLVRSRGRACLTCVAAKTKCTGIAPCRRCEEKGLACEYPRRLNSSTEAPESGGRTSFEADALVADRAEKTHDSNSDRPHTAFDTSCGQPQGLRTNFVEHVNDSALSRHTLEISSPFRPSDPQSSDMESSGQARIAPRFSGFDLNGWNPGSSSAINWLQTEYSSPQYAQIRDLFPTLFSTHTFSSNTHPDLRTRASTDASTSALEPAAVVLTPSPGYARSIATTTPQESSGDDRTSISIATDLYGRNEGEEGALYVDGSKARQSRHKRRRVMSYGGHHSEIYLSLSLPTALSYLDSYVGTQHMSEQQHDQMKSYFDTLCMRTNFFRPFLSSEVLSKEAFSHIIELYFEHFSPVLPFLHRQTFQGKSRHLAMLLAMAALGCRFLNHTARHSLGSSISEFLKRMLYLMDEEKTTMPRSRYELAQIRLLHSIATRYPAVWSPGDFTTTHIQQSPVLIEIDWQDGVSSDTGTSSQPRWLDWVQKEELKRTFHCIWLVDCIVASHAEQRPMFRLATAAEHELPCTESLWEADTPEAWNRLKHVHSYSPTLQKTLQHLYIEKRLSQNLGEFARVIVIHGLYQRTWEVREYLQQGLSHFEPSAQEQSSEDIMSPVPIWHSSMEPFNKWRNSALDCLDLLHWNANALIGLAHGMEHPTVLHLHFSRVVLLSPLRPILHFAKFLSGFWANMPAKSRLEQAEQDLQTIQQWVVRDQYKARLAAIHAGSLFWHTRRYSTNAFYEPETVALATLMLWALSKFTPNKQTTGNAQTTGARPSDTCDIILLDRPVDDELVQQYVRQGDTMHANITGVGDLFRPAGPQRVLVEGRKLLSTFGAWEEATTFWLHLLSRLEVATVDSVPVGVTGGITS